MTPELAKILKEAHDYILLDRDCLYESITLDDGSIPNKRDRDDLEAVDDLLNRLQAVMKDAGTNEA